MKEAEAFRLERTRHRRSSSHDTRWKTSPVTAATPSRRMSEAIIDCDAVLFDMDGTLVDSRQIVERIWLHWAAEHGLPAADILAVAHGRRTLETMQLVAPHLATPEEAARLDRLEAEEEGHETAIPGAAALLAALPPDRWAVVTSAGHQLALRRLAAVGLPLPRVLVGADDVAHGKPAPDGYLRAATALGVTAARTVVLEDTPPGAQAGRAAGATVIGLRTTFPTVAGCDFLVPDLRAIRVSEPASAAIRLIIDG
jgi:mannitol-1-/sugar-/sorbitol-6-phosphatase